MPQLGPFDEISLSFAFSLKNRLLVPLGRVSSAPSAGGVSPLLARDYTGYDQCNDGQSNKINRAFQDAAVIARQYNKNRGSQAYRTSPA
ncbi:hypothetical protein F4819DRAFT_485644 [Hypoxylon fuscum]|nr:hypothetical protein F4819DRAFT_485644 [Hypoxylon fuscum]